MKKILRTPFTIRSASAFALGLAFVTATFAQQSAGTPADPTGGKDPAAAAPPTSAAQATAKPNVSKATSPAAATKNKTPEPVNLQVASDSTKDRTDSKLSGREVKGADGKGLGNIKDFLVNPSAGRVEFAVISTGGVAGIGDKLRLVPLQSLHLAGEKEFSIGIAKDQWDQIAPFSADAYKAAQTSMTDSERRQIVSHFSANKAADDSAPYTASLTSSLVKARDLHGKDVRAAGRTIGKLDGIVIDLPQGSAQALFDPTHDFAGTSQKFLVPMNQFTLGGEHEPASTSLTREAFDRATGHNQISSSSSGSLPIAANPTAATPENHAVNSGTNTDRDARMAGTSSKDQSPTAATGTATNSTAQPSTKSEPTKVASTPSSSSSSKSSTAPSQGGATTSDIALSHTDRADTNGVNPAAVASNSTVASSTTESKAAAQADAQSPAASPRSEKSQDIASTVPASHSSKAPNAGQSANSSVAANDQKSDPRSKSTSPSTQASSSGLAANSTPSRASTAETTPSTNPASSGQNLMPTGRTSAEQAPSADPALNSAALAIRKAFDDNPSLARLNVAVTPESGKLVLRGSVATSQLKTAIENTAERAANGKAIDSQVTIENQ